MCVSSAGTRNENVPSAAVEVPRCRSLTEMTDTPTIGLPASSRTTPDTVRTGTAFGHYRTSLCRCGFGVLRQYDGVVDEPVGEAQLGSDAFEHLVHGHLPCRDVYFARYIDAVVAVKYFVSGLLLDFGQQGRERFFL